MSNPKETWISAFETAVKGKYAEVKTKSGKRVWLLNAPKRLEPWPEDICWPDRFLATWGSEQTAEERKQEAKAYAGDWPSALRPHLPSCHMRAEVRMKRQDGGDNNNITLTEILIYGQASDGGKEQHVEALHPDSERKLANIQAWLAPAIEAHVSNNGPGVLKAMQLSAFERDEIGTFLLWCMEDDNRTMLTSTAIGLPESALPLKK